MTLHSPKPLGDPITHYWLVLEMARAAGVDLADAMEAGRLSHEGWAGMVERCRGCDWQRDGGCTRWLTMQDAGGAEVPGSCLNQQEFDALAEPTAPEA
ncbi:MULTISPECIES: DUF6455 family protein [unclassified Meridianimarinicoccus]|uniref:DUF6455 family protein n=1 Tax=unclassified Meridianimarinicoccus TaxID=2923344 RepID=UPI001866D535|nr:DUF6455 family protein [Fluviibacterium sp. MJW13]